MIVEQISISFQRFWVMSSETLPHLMRRVKCDEVWRMKIVFAVKWDRFRVMLINKRRRWEAHVTI